MGLLPSARKAKQAASAYTSPAWLAPSPRRRSGAARVHADDAEVREALQEGEGRGAGVHADLDENVSGPNL